jgi:hypothetical protein
MADIPFIVIRWRNFQLAASGRLAMAVVIGGIALVGFWLALR